MSSVCVFTSFTYAYLSRALVLSESLREFHPGWTLCAILTDEEPEGYDRTVMDRAFDFVWHSRELGIPQYESWLFKHDVVEACTAVKGHALVKLLKLFDKVLYLDPDIAVFSPLDDVVRNLDDCSIVLTPHQTAPSGTMQAVRDNELTAMRYGIYNLGFVAVRSDETGRTFANWWATQLYRACYDDLPNGIFTDQRYCDLVPALFDRVHIERDPGYNVASWNLSSRDLSISEDGSIYVNSSPLRFYHFTKIGGAGDVMTARYGALNVCVFEVWEWYRRRLEQLDVHWARRHEWSYARYDNEQPIPREDRVLYRERRDLSRAFPRPFATAGSSFYRWLELERIAI